MEDNIQTIIIVIISAFILFVFPVYMAYEKKDDISYSLAMRYTQDLVDEVRSKGYITKNMYDDYRVKLKLTGNSYDIKLTHEYNRYDPITNYYKIEDNKYILVKTTTMEQREEFEKEQIKEAIDTGKLKENSSDKEIEDYLKELYKNKQGVDVIEDTYQISKQVYNTNHIEGILNSERKLKLNSTQSNIRCSDIKTAEDGCEYAYIMNVDDNFNITIKNTNITLATVLYNMVTANTLDKNTRIYVNYGGSIISTKWYGEVDYTKMDHDKISLSKLIEGRIADFDSTKEVYPNQVTYYEVDQDKTINIVDFFKKYNGLYSIEFDVKPNVTTELREKGQVKTADFTGYNFAMGNNKENNQEDMLSVSVGLNGISLILNKTEELTSSNRFNLDQYKKVITSKAITSVICREKRIYYTPDTEEQEEIYEIVSCSDITNSTDLDDYSRVSIQYLEEDKFKVSLEGGAGVDDVIIEVTADTNNTLEYLNSTTTSLGSNIEFSGNLANVNNKMGTPSKYTIKISDNNIEVLVEREELTKVTDYSNITLNYINDGMMRVELIGKSGVASYSREINLNGAANLFKELGDIIFNSPEIGNIKNGRFGSATNSRGTNIVYHIELTDTVIIINAAQTVSQEQTILSYPVTIDDYTKLKIEMEKKEDSKYVANLYIEDEKVDESIEMPSIPRINVIGKTIIGNEERFFDGYVKNTKIYSNMSN